jgi:hypothetical protein
MKGAIVRINETEWAHISCVHWIPELSFNEKTYRLEGKLLNKRTKMTCSICKTTGIGA